MATYGQTIRRGLPRRPGGAPWPPPGIALADADAGTGYPELTADIAQAAEPAEALSAAPAAAVDAPPAVQSTSPRIRARGTGAEPAPGTAGDGARAIRRGLPRLAGGEPWPPPTSVPAAASPGHADESGSPSPVTDQPVRETRRVSPPAATETGAPPTPGNGVASAVAAAEPPRPLPAGPERPLRRGLPRVAGGDPWPPAGYAVRPSPVLANQPETPAQVTDRAIVPEVDLSVPLPFTRTVFPGRAAVQFERERLSGERVLPAEPKLIGPFTRLQWLGAGIVVGGGVLFAAGMAVVAVRWLLSLEPMQEFLVAYPGEYPLPEGAPVGIPPWLGWQHFFNTFLIVLIIRSGLQVRSEKRPSVFWSPRNNGKRKISLNLWFHQSLDVLWVANGVIFVVLLFITGQWMKIVPTSWAVFPNAVSAALQYVSLDWPTENGWVNYNSLQQLAYFATVFLAAPLAIATGVRMSGIWPKNATALNKAYPVEWARRVHFPVMVYFVLFIIVHVALVLATGALRNLNHMYASQDAVNWTGLWIFAVSLLVITAGWVAARPLVLAPIARLFGTVSGR